MLNKLRQTIREYALVSPGQHIICACSGGADSVALLFGMFLLKEQLEIQLSAAHFNHHLRGKESDRDEMFVRDFCDRYDIPLQVGQGTIVPGKKGLEAAARDARYAYFRTLQGTIATAHTANDNAETVLMHLVRGTGLSGLGGIAPKRDGLIRPMLQITRQEVMAFLEEYHLPFVQDSSNETDDFLRNRLRHHVMPLLQEENLRFAENTSAMALNLRKDAEVLAGLTELEETDVTVLRQLQQAVRSRVLEHFLKKNGVREPERRHIALLEQLVFSENPSAKADFPGEVTIGRKYNHLVVLVPSQAIAAQNVAIPGATDFPEIGKRLICKSAEEICNTQTVFTVCTQGAVLIRSRQTGDQLSLPGGTKSLKKLLIDRKIPASERDAIPVLADESGILGVFGIGADQKRKAETLPAWQFSLEDII